MKNMKKLKLSIWIITFIPLISYIIYYFNSAITYAVAWNEFGEVTEYITKTPSIFIVPLLLIFLSFIIHFIREILGEKEITFLKVKYEVIWLWIMLFLGFASLMPLYLIFTGGGNSYDVLAAILAVIAILVLIAGFVFPSFKKDSKYGFKTPWTNQSAEIFLKTQQVASTTFIIGSLLLAAITFFVNEYTTIAILSYILVMLLLIYIPIKFSKNKYENE